MNRVIRHSAVAAGVALALAACGGQPTSAAEFRQQVAKTVDTAHSALQTIDVALEQTGRGSMTSALSRVTLEDAAKDLSSALQRVRALDAPGAEGLKGEIVAALTEAAAVGDQGKAGVDRRAAAALEPRARAAVDHLEAVAAKLPPPD